MITKRQISYLTVVFIYVVLFGCSKRQAEEIVPQVTPPVTTPKKAEGVRQIIWGDILLPVCICGRQSDFIRH